MAANTKCILIILLVAMIWGPNGLAQTDDTGYEIVDSNEIPDVLSMLASVTQANFEKIKTWQGRITSKDIITIRGERAAEYLTKSTDADPNALPSEIQRIINSAIEFKIDVDNNRFFSLSQRTGPPVYLDPQSDTAYPLQWGSGESIFIATSEYQIEIMPLRETKDHVVLSRLARKVRPWSIRITDPRNVFHLGPTPLWRWWSGISQFLKDSGTETFGVVIKKQSTAGNITYRMELSDPGEERPSTILVLSGEAGFNRTYAANWYDDGSLRSEVVTEFVNVQGVFLPGKWNVTQYFPDGGLRLRENFTIENQQINTSIPDSTFSEHSYLHDGDRFRDNLAGKKFEYKDGKLVELATKPAKH